jgi:hypothetical protein
MELSNFFIYNQMCFYKSKYEKYNDPLTIAFYQGWTDIILCIGLVFYNLKTKNINLIIRYDSSEMINFIFRNIQKNKLNIIYTNKCLNSNKVCWDNYLKEITNNSKYKFYAGAGGDKYGFYKDYGIDPNESINSFLIDRDIELEKNMYDKVTKEIGVDYIVIMNDVKRKICINEKYISDTYKKLPRFNLCNCSKICFDMLTVIENAKEIHIFSTFWSLIIYQLQKKYNMYNDKKIFFHNSVRDGYFFKLYENNNWIIV